MDQNEIIDLVQKQVEYYLSDENLKQDAFFHSKISSSENGFIPIQFLLNCNKMKKLTEDKEIIKKAIEKSSLLELGKNDTLKRKNDKLPVLSLLSKKRGTDKNTEAASNEKVSKEIREDEVVIYTIKTSKCIDVTWKVIQESIIKNNPDLIISYLRFTKDAGHLGLANKNIPNLKINEFPLQEDEDKDEKTIITISKSSADDLVDFWKQHGSHLKLCLSKDLNRNNKNNKNGKGKDKDKRSNKKNEDDDDLFKKKSITKLNKPITLGHHKFIDIKDIRQKSRTIMNNIKEGEKPLTHDAKFLEDILAFHPNQEKAKNMDYFTVGQNPNYPDSKCFIIYKKDGSKIDFSVNKCLDKIIETNN